MIKKLNYRFLILLFIYAVFYFYALGKYPPIWVDEPWLAEPAWNWVKLGKFVNLTFTGYYNYDVFEMGNPVFHLLLAGAFKLFGLNIIAARSISVIFALLTLAVVYETVKLICRNENIALIAASILALNPVFFQCAREIRQEAVITFFAVLSFYFLLKAVNEEKLFFYLLCGIFSGLCILTHYSGLVVIAALFLIIFFRNKKASLCYTSGVFIITIGWIVFILLNFQLFEHQVMIQCKTKIFFVNKFTNNLLSEYRRWMYPSIAVPALFSLGSLLYLSFTNYKKYSLLINYSVIFMILLGLIDTSKTFLYSNLIFPFFAAVISISCSEVYKKRRFLAVGLLLILLFASGIFLPYKLYKFLPSDYYGLTDKFKEVIPKNSAIIGQTTYWFGLEENYRLRSFDLPYYYMDNYKISFKNAIKLIKADYIIFDNYWAYIYKNYQKETEDFLKSHCILIKTITDRYYGNKSDMACEPENIKIYKVVKTNEN